jgi:hypothetical protein
LGIRLKTGDWTQVQRRDAALFFHT